MRSLPCTGLSAFLVCLIITCGGKCPAQEASPPVADQPSAEEAPGESLLYLKFVNSRTGLAVKSGHVHINDQPVSPVAVDGGLLVIKVADGTHVLRAESEGFAPMELQVTVSGPDTPVMQVEMDPAEDAATPEIADDETVMHGTVVDADSAEAIAGARVSISDSSLTAQTTATGEFRFELKTGAVRDAQRPAVTLEAAAEGYQGVRMKNIPLAAGTALRLPIHLNRKTTAPAEQEIVELDQWTRPGGDFLSEWVFDVTLR